MILLKDVSYEWEDGRTALKNINLEIKKGEFVLISGKSGSEMLEALNRMKVPRSIGIPFSVLLRFVPTIKIELKALKENMKIRGIVTSRFFPLLHPIKYIEYTLVPLLMRMIKISDELSASALIRGLDSDEKRVTLTELRFRKTDLMIGLLGALMIALVIVIQKIY